MFECFYCVDESRIDQTAFDEPALNLSVCCTLYRKPAVLWNVRFLGISKNRSAFYRKRKFLESVEHNFLKFYCII